MKLPDSCRIIVCNGFGRPDVLRVMEQPVPQPGPGRILIKVAAIGVNRADLLQREGNYPPPSGVGDILGLEVSGIVAAAGENVTGWEIGDPVCALLDAGGYAEYVIAEADLCFPVPGQVDLKEAAALPEAVMTCYANIIEHGGLQKGETILIHGGSSGIGTVGIQLAKAWGATVIVTAGTDEKIKLCGALGADLAVNYKTQDFAEEIRQFARQRGMTGVDVVLDMVGGDYVDRNLSVMAPKGRHVSIAVQGGRKARIDLFAVMQKQLVLTGSTLRAQPLPEKARLARNVKNKIWPLIGQGKIRPVTGAVFPFEDAGKAHELMESGRHFGKIILVV